MKRVLRLAAALAALSFAAPVLACGYEKPQTTATPASTPPVAKTDVKQKAAKPAKAEKAKPARTDRVSTTNF
jgi:hypothetical protein